MNPFPVRIAHRGASAEAPENTLAAIRRAVALGCEAIEWDVRLSRDGVPVLLHDERLDRTTTGVGPVEEWTWEVLRHLDAGRWKGPEFAGEPIPTLEEALLAVPEDTTAVVELKTPASAEPALAVVRKLDRLRDVVFIAFETEALRRVRAAEPRAAVGWLLGRWPVPDDPVASARTVRERLSELGTSLLDVAEGAVTEPFLQTLHRLGVTVWTWTVDEPKRMQELLALGVDGITTNRLDRLNRLRSV